MDPEQEFLAGFWSRVKDDLHGVGCTMTKKSGIVDGLTYEDRVRLEREQLKRDTTRFIHSDDFEWWAIQSNLDSNTLRGKLLCH